MRMDVTFDAFIITKTTVSALRAGEFCAVKKIKVKILLVCNRQVLVNRSLIFFLSLICDSKKKKYSVFFMSNVPEEGEKLTILQLQNKL